LALRHKNNRYRFNKHSKGEGESLEKCKLIPQTHTCHQKKKEKQIRGHCWVVVRKYNYIRVEKKLENREDYECA